MSHSLADALREHTSNERKIRRIVSEHGDGEVFMTKRQIGKIIDKNFPKKRARQEEEEEYDEEEECARTLSSLSEDCASLKALTYMYSQTDRNDPFSRILYDKMRKVAERIEPSEVVGDDPTIDTIVNMSDRIRHYFPNFQGDVPKETLFEIGRLAKEYHIEYYHCPPTKTQRTIHGQEKYINVYTEETAPNTLDRAIREVMNEK